VLYNNGGPGGTWWWVCQRWDGYVGYGRTGIERGDQRDSDARRGKTWSGVDSEGMAGGSACAGKANSLAKKVEPPEGKRVGTCTIGRGNQQGN